MYGHSTCFVLWVERDWFHFKSPSDPSVFIVGPILRSEDCQSEQQSAHHDYHWWPTADYIRTMEAICIPMITRFDRLMFLFRDMEDNIMRLNGEFELQLTTEDRVEGDGEGVPIIMSANQFSMIEVFGNTRKRMCSWIILSHSINVLSHLCHSIPISCCTMCLPIKL